MGTFFYSQTGEPVKQSPDMRARGPAGQSLPRRVHQRTRPLLPLFFLKMYWEHFPVSPLTGAWLWAFPSPLTPLRTLPSAAQDPLVATDPTTRACGGRFSSPTRPGNL